MGKRKFTAEYKTRLVLEVLREERELGGIAAANDISPNQLRNWKSEFMGNVTRVFNQSKQEKDIQKKEKELEAERNELMSKIGQLTMERDWLKKNQSKCLDLTTKRSLLKSPSKLTMKRRCELLEVPRTSVYRKPKGRDMGWEEQIKSRLDDWHTKMPYLGVRRLREQLGKEGLQVGRKRLRRYMQEMGIYAVYPKPNLSKRNQKHKVYPYLLRNLEINHPGQVWGIDITYIRMFHGHMYLTAIIDWNSRFIVGWELSDTLDTAPVLAAVRKAIAAHGKPEIINSDQGCQFTSADYTSFLKEQSIRQSMDGKARWVDNIMIERWFRSLKVENIYIAEYKTPRALRAGIRSYIDEYNYVRPHQSLEYSTPADRFGCPFPIAANL